MKAFRQALRSLHLSPSFTFTVIATLAIGISLNAAIFTVVDNVLLKPLGFHETDRVPAIRSHLNDENRSIPRLGGDDYVDLAHDFYGLEATAQYQQDTDGFSLNGTPQEVRPVTLRLFSTAGMPILSGRNIAQTDNDERPAVLVINKASADAVFPRIDPVGQQVMCGYDDKSTWRTVAGVVWQHCRGRSGPASFAHLLRSRGPAREPRYSYADCRANPGRPRHHRAQGRFELGLRTALGGSRSQLLTAVLVKAFRTTLIGIAVGTASPPACKGFLGSILGKLPAFDFAAYLLATWPCWASRYWPPGPPPGALPE